MTTKPTTLTDVELDPCPACGSRLGPFYADQTKQVTCSTCGMRGPYATLHETGEDRWNSLLRPEDTEAIKLAIILREARHTIAELKTIGEHRHANRVQRLVRSRIGANSENVRIHKAIKSELDEATALKVLRK